MREINHPIHLHPTTQLMAHVKTMLKMILMSLKSKQYIFSPTVVYVINYSLKFERKRHDWELNNKSLLNFQIILLSARCKPCSSVKASFLCGTDNHTYSSICRLNYYNCVQSLDVRKVCNGFCPCKGGFCFKFLKKYSKLKQNEYR